MGNDQKKVLNASRTGTALRVLREGLPWILLNSPGIIPNIGIQEVGLLLNSPKVGVDLFALWVIARSREPVVCPVSSADAYVVKDASS